MNNAHNLLAAQIAHLRSDMFADVATFVSDDTLDYLESATHVANALTRVVLFNDDDLFTALMSSLNDLACDGIAPAVYDYAVDNGYIVAE